MVEVSVLRYPFGTLDKSDNILRNWQPAGNLENEINPVNVESWVKSARNKNSCKMPPPGGGAGGANVGYIKEKPDPWEVRTHLFTKLWKYFDVKIIEKNL